VQSTALYDMHSLLNSRSLV